MIVLVHSVIDSFYDSIVHILADADSHTVPHKNVTFTNFGGM